MKAAERAARDADVLRLFMAGASYRTIARAVNLRSHSQVHEIVQRELTASAQRRALLSDEALAVHTERTERLFQAHWKRALDGDHRSAELCRRMLADNAKLNQLYPDATGPLPAPTPTAGGDVDDEDEGPQDELARMRAARTGA